MNSEKSNSSFVHAALAFSLYHAGRPEEAIPLYKKAIRLSPIADSWFLSGLGACYRMMGRYEEAISAFKRAINILGFPYMGPLLGHAYAISGDKKEAEKIITDVNELSKENYVSSFHRSAIHVALKDNDQAFELLEKAFENRDNWLVTINIDPRFDNIRSDSRFIQLLKKLEMHK